MKKNLFILITVFTLSSLASASDETKACESLVEEFNITTLNGRGFNLQGVDKMGRACKVEVYAGYHQNSLYCNFEVVNADGLQVFSPFKSDIFEIKKLVTYKSQFHLNVVGKVTSSGLLFQGEKSYRSTLSIDRTADGHIFKAVQAEGIFSKIEAKGTCLVQSH